MEYSIQIRAKMFQIFHLGSRMLECSNYKEQLAREDLNVFSHFVRPRLELACVTAGEVWKIQN
jgi:hypothetical protein